MRVEKTISGWRQTTLGNETRIRRGASPRPIDNPRWFSSDGPAWIRIADVTASVRQLLRTTQRLSSEGAMLSVSVSPGQVIMSIAATVGRPIIVGIDACIHDGFVVFDRHSRLDPGFLVHHLRQMEPYFTGQGQTGTQANINTQIVEASPLRLPSLAEQRTIAAVLDTIDDAIQKTEQIIAKLQQVKQGLLHDLLTRGIDDNGELRDPDRHPEQFQDSPLGRIPKGWDVEKLRVLYSEPSRNGLYKGPAYHGRGAPMIQMGNLFASDEVSFSDTGRVSVSESELRTFGLRVGDILFARRSLVFEGAGRAAVVGVVPEPATFESSIVRVRLRTERILPRFAVTYLASHQGYLRRRAHIRQVAVSGVSGTDIASFFMAIPTLSEQQTIVETKAILDLQIENEARARGALMSMKNGLSDDLLTGRVRTTSLPEFSA